MTERETFEKISSQLISRLAERWPKPLSLNPADFGFPEEDDGKGVADLWDQWSEVVLWTQREGLIRFRELTTGTCGEPCFYDVELTQKGREMNFDSFPQSEIDIVAPDGTVRSSTKAIVTPKAITIADVQTHIFAGDEIRRLIPNGTEEAFEVIDPVFNQKFHSIPAHYSVKYKRKGAFPKGMGGNYIFNVSGPNARVNFQSTDNSVNKIGDDTVFRDLKIAIQNSGIDTQAIENLQNCVGNMESARGKSEFKQEYQNFIQQAAAYMTIVSPFIPALTSML
ncbi:hypothetical protein [Methylobacterium sp. V23]|uniref:hypothetical protein n=1 Tax=Methylobacterium sp. V23 TaxID=2044878 RepID=UPI0011B0390F|nr:hypothetical protein [Methylobacterium sp. V23]